MTTQPPKRFPDRDEVAAVRAEADGLAPGDEDDVRSGNVKRVASAVGEGSIAIHLVHRVLAEL